jgi:hypothetical protein
MTTVAREKLHMAAGGGMADRQDRVAELWQPTRCGSSASSTRRSPCNGRIGWNLPLEPRSSSRPPHRANAEKADFAFAFNAPSKPFWAATGRLRRHPKLRVTRTCGAEDEVQVPHAHPDTSPPEGCTPHHQQKQDSRIPAAGSSGEQGA